MTLGAVPIPARVIAVVLVSAAITPLQMASKVSRAAVLDIGHGFYLPWRQGVTGSEGLTVEAEDLRYLQHGRPPLKPVNHLVNGLRGLLEDRWA